jgi:hypothetical protein
MLRAAGAVAAAAACVGLASPALAATARRSGAQQPAAPSAGSAAPTLTASAATVPNGATVTFSAYRQG